MRAPTLRRPWGVHFEPHESLYLGGDYWLAKVPEDGLAVRIRPNRDLLWRPGDSEAERFAFPDYCEHPWLLEITGESRNTSAALSAVESVRLLQAEAQ